MASIHCRRDAYGLSPFQVNPNTEHRKLAAIMFTDMVGYSALSQSKEALALELLEEHRCIVRDLLPQYGGREVQTTGDGFLIDFPSALVALQAAVAIQHAFHNRNQANPPERQLSIRIGIHVGDVVQREGNIQGDGVNIAARLEPLAPAGGICISNAVYEEVRNKSDQVFAQLGPTKLKNIKLPVTVHHVVMPWEKGSPRILPGPRPRTLWLWIGAGLAALVAAVLLVLLPSRPEPAVPVPTQTALQVNEKSIAVLPFVNMSSDKEQEYFSDGIAEELLNLLAKIPELHVAARTSAFSFKGRNLKMEEIGRELRVKYVLEGSVRKSGNKVRITAQLIHVADGYHVWSDAWDRTLDDIFKVQDEIAGAVVGQMKISLLGAAPNAKAIDPKVYALILQANFLADQSTAEGNVQALALYQQAQALAPGEVRVLDGLASVYVSQADNNERPIADGYRLAREAANKALASDPDYAPAHARLGWIAMSFDGDLATAAQHYKRGLELDPTNLEVLSRATVFLQTLGRLDESIAIHEYLTAHDPANPNMHTDLGVLYYSAGRWDQAIASLRTALTLNKGLDFAHFQIGAALLGKSDTTGALVEMQAEPAEMWRLNGLALAYHALGRKAESDAALATLIARYEKDASFNIAYVLAYRGETDRAFDWLDKAVAYQDMGLSGIAIDPLLINIRHDARWLPFLRKVGKAPEQMAAIKFDVKLPN